MGSYNKFPFHQVPCQQLQHLLAPTAVVKGNASTSQFNGEKSKNELINTGTRSLDMDVVRLAENTDVGNLACRIYGVVSPGRGDQGINTLAQGDP